MHILVVGAGAVGGYFGGRLAEKGEQVTFLVRPKRYEQLQKTGLQITSPHGDITITPQLVTHDMRPDHTFDVVLLSTKAYHLDDVLKDLAPFVSEDTYIIPLLNGMQHIRRLTEVFGEDRVLGGLCFIESTLDTEGRIVQTSPSHRLLFGSRIGKPTARLEEIATRFAKAKAPMAYSTHIMDDMWQKYLFISTFAGVTTLFRSAIGPIRQEPVGRQMIIDVMKESKQAMEEQGAVFNDDVEAVLMKQMNAMEDKMKSSMLRDMEKGQRVEVDHFFTTLLKTMSQRHLQLIESNLGIYQKNQEMHVD
ncbi:2-dehydropantoate 2-reductase [Exiguobacterium sp. BMC-KP]|uniref:ketopantoate reductase family protein n=1 Tax=Exiguobacterium sp. BMC-KP TaxID=1684312 RepID=UPI0006AA502D|nr:ketopantoate reductase family protein [Exiguobacterium sp. BMC-KP]KOP31186.1 2-dehydropantoate 2-reductase [Exiguobacterium sp. BMC-KP]